MRVSETLFLEISQEFHSHDQQERTRPPTPPVTSSPMIIYPGGAPVWWGVFTWPTWDVSILLGTFFPIANHWRKERAWCVHCSPSMDSWGPVPQLLTLLKLLWRSHASLSVASSHFVGECLWWLRTGKAFHCFLPFRSSLWWNISKSLAHFWELVYVLVMAVLEFFYAWIQVLYQVSVCGLSLMSINSVFWTEVFNFDEL